jgi:hypothetical protein
VTAASVGLQFQEYLKDLLAIGWVQENATTLVTLPSAEENIVVDIGTPSEKHAASSQARTANGIQRKTIRPVDTIGAVDTATINTTVGCIKVQRNR